MTVARRHGHRQSLWGFHVSFADSAAQPVWQTLIGASAAQSADSPAFVDHMAALLASTVDGDSQTRLTALEAALNSVPTIELLFANTRSRDPSRASAHGYRPRCCNEAYSIGEPSAR